MIKPQPASREALQLGWDVQTLRYLVGAGQEGAEQGVCPFPGSPVSLRVHGGSRLRPIFAQDGFYFVFVNWRN